jgi:hypothetical protein
MILLRFVFCNYLSLILFLSFFSAFLFFFFSRTFEEFTRIRRPATDALAELSLQNYIEMRSLTGKTWFPLEKTLRICAHIFDSIALATHLFNGFLFPACPTTVQCAKPNVKIKFCQSQWQPLEWLPQPFWPNDTGTMHGRFQSNSGTKSNLPSDFFSNWF